MRGVEPDLELRAGARWKPFTKTSSAPGSVSRASSRRMNASSGGLRSFAFFVMVQPAPAGAFQLQALIAVDR